MVSRRVTLGLAAGALAFVRGLGTRPARAARGPVWIGTRLDADGKAFATGFDAEGRQAFDLPLPARGHGIAVTPDDRVAVILGRRPGLFAFAVSLPDGKVLAQFEPGQGRHFCGHGLFVLGGALFLATETDWEGERGLIGVYDVMNGFARIAEWETGGLDPHDVRLLPGGQQIVVANGGILTHPDAPGAKLNLAEMDSSLSVIDLSGAIVRQYRLAPDLFQLSIRHLVVGGDGTVGFIMQYEGPADRLVPLGGLLRPSGEVTLLDMPRGDLADLRQYCGSGATDAAHETFGITSPRGGAAAFFRFADGAYLGSRRLSDVCPIAADPEAPKGHFYLAGGHGGVHRVALDTKTGEALASDLARQSLWDNHMTVAVPG